MAWPVRSLCCWGGTGRSLMLILPIAIHRHPSKLGHNYLTRGDSFLCHHGSNGSATTSLLIESSEKCPQSMYWNFGLTQTSLPSVFDWPYQHFTRCTNTKGCLWRFNSKRTKSCSKAAATFPTRVPRKRVRRHVSLPLSHRPKNNANE